MKEPTYIDVAGRTWHMFTLQWRNEIDDQTFSVGIWAIDLAHAWDQLGWIKQNGHINGQVMGVVPA